MSNHFKRYVDNLNRIRFADLIDRYGLMHRTYKLKASLVVNPLTGQPYMAPHIPVRCAMPDHGL